MVALIGRLMVPVALLVYALLYYLNIRELPVEAGLLPQIMLAIVAALLLWDLTDETLQWRRSDHRSWRDGVRYVASRFRQRGLRPAGIMALTGVWIFWAMTTLGFYVATTLYLLFALVILGERRGWLVVALTAGGIAATFVLFTVALNLRLPSGMFV